jgi:hypothetical protein
VSLKDISTEDLVSRWDMIIDGYLKDVVSVRNSIVKLEKTRNELLLIREELSLRKIEVDAPEDRQEQKEIGKQKE